jgi:hypothetical protein
MTALASISALPLGASVSARVQVLRVRSADGAKKTKVLEVWDGSGDAVNETSAHLPARGIVVPAKVSDSLLAAMGSSSPPLRKWILLLNFRVSHLNGSSSLISLGSTSSVRVAPQAGLELDDDATESTSQ